MSQGISFHSLTDDWCPQREHSAASGGLRLWHCRVRMRRRTGAAPPNRGHAAGAKRFQLCSSATTRGPEDELSISNKFPGLTCYICLMWSNRFAKRMSEASKLTSLFLICSCGAINLPAIVVSRISMWMTVSNPSFPFLFPGWVKTKRGTREEFLSPLPASRLHTIELSSSTLQWASGRKIQSPDSTLPLTFKGQVSLYRT